MHDTIAVHTEPTWRDLPRRIAEGLGRWLILLGALAAGLAHPRQWLRPTMGEASRQISDSFWLVILVAMVGGALIAQQTGVQFEGNLPSWVVGSIVAASVVTEVTPLFAGFVMVGVIGTRIAAEIGSMRVTEQVDALEVIGRDPVAHLILPRVAGAAIAAPLLMSFALAASVLAGWLAAVLVTRATSADFWFGVRHYMRDFPLFFALIKGTVFGVGLTLIACYEGLSARGGSAGVGRATRKAVVVMIVAIIVLDACLVPLLKAVRA